MIITFKGRKIEVEARETGTFSKFSGLMLRSSKTQNLSFKFASPKTASIHSFFVFFPFLALWLDEKNSVTDHQIVEPFTLKVSPKSPAKRLLELPLNRKNREIIEFFVGKKKDLNIP